MSNCKDCEHFHIISKPMGHFEVGQVVCNKHNLITEYVSMHKINNLTCIEEGSEENE